MEKEVVKTQVSYFEIEVNGRPIVIDKHPKFITVKENEGVRLYCNICNKYHNYSYQYLVDVSPDDNHIKKLRDE
jgi:hypothetical protein